MRFSHIDGMDVVTRIAGPVHHLLGIEFGAGPGDEAVVEAMGLDGAPRIPAAGETTPDEIRRQVALGIATANRELLTSLAARRIRYCPDDPATPRVYQELTLALARRAALDGSPITGGSLHTGSSR